MMAVTVETEGTFSFSAPELLFTGQFTAIQDPTADSYDVAHDGRFLMIQPRGGADESGSTSIVVVQNWTEELKRRVPSRN
jgi:hypothetical protein